MKWWTQAKARLKNFLNRFLDRITKGEWREIRKRGLAVDQWLRAQRAPRYSTRRDAFANSLVALAVAILVGYLIIRYNLTIEPPSGLILTVVLLEAILLILLVREYCSKP